MRCQQCCNGWFAIAFTMVERLEVCSVLWIRRALSWKTDHSNSNSHKINVSREDFQINIGPKEQHRSWSNIKTHVAIARLKMVRQN